MIYKIYYVYDKINKKYYYDFCKDNITNIELDTNITDDSYAYFHNSLEGDLTTIQFRTATANSTTGKYDAKEYQALPVGAKGFETGSGPSARPTFTIANVLSTFSDQLDGLTNDDLLGKN